MSRPKGVFASLLAEMHVTDEGAFREDAPSRDDDPCTPREPRAERRPAARRRSERLHALRGRRERRPLSDFLSLEDVCPREESLETKCARPSLRFQAQLDLVVMRPLTAGEAAALEVHEREPAEAGSGRPEERVPPYVEVERVRALKPAGVLAHLRALDRALCVCDR